MGDVFFNGFYPFVDVSSDGSLDGYIAAVERVLALPFVNNQTKIIPGHGPLATPADLRSYLTMMQTARQRISALIDRGLSEDQAVAADPMADHNAEWGGGFMNPENFVRLSYQSLSP
jgi:glyoxylase-like metal-dependent hydrolase (beta-lactamase superfamily II)